MNTNTRPPSAFKMLTIFAICLLALLAPVYVKSYYSSSKLKEPAAVELKVNSVEQLKQIIESLPDGAFKANIYIVLATEYAGDSTDLHAILSAYAKMQMQKLQGEKKGNTI